MLSCKDITELVTEYLEGRLGLWRRISFEMHLGLCRHCRRYLRQMRETVSALGELPPEAMPPEVRDELLERFRDWKKSEPVG